MNRLYTVSGITKQVHPTHCANLRYGNLIHSICNHHISRSASDFIVLWRKHRVVICPRLDMHGTPLDVHPVVLGWLLIRMKSVERAVALKMKTAISDTVRIVVRIK